MIENLNTAGLITLIGMSLVFASIILLWGVMALLVRVTADRVKVKKTPGSSTVDETHIESDAELNIHRRQAAIVAVVVALEKARSPEIPHELKLPPTAIVSAWQAVLRSSNIRQRGPIR